jgi:site-specific DNA recombinase
VLNSSLTSILPENKAIAYVRVSTKRQKEKNSIPYQIDLAKKFVDKYNKDILADIEDSTDKKSSFIYLDDAMIFEEVRPASTVSNKPLTDDLIDSLGDRPELQEILYRAEKREFGHLIVQSRDRLSRNFEQFITLKYILKKNNITIHYCRPGENLDFEDAKINRFVDNILGSVAALESDIISVRVKSGSKQCIENGNWAGGRPPLGYLIERYKAEEKKRPVARLKTSYYERNQVLKVYSLYNLGFSYREIAEKINHELNENIWTKSKVEGILKNQTYTGYITWNRRGGRRKPGKHSGPYTTSKFNENICFISKDHWESIEKLRTYKKELNDPKYFDTPYLLKNKLICGTCNNKLKTKNYGRNSSGENVCVYRCTNLSDKKSEIILRKTEIENIVFSKIKEELNNIDVNSIWSTYSIELEKIKKRSKQLIDAIERKITSVKVHRKNIQLMINDLRNTISSENNAAIVAANKINSTLIDKLIYEDTLLLKAKQKFEGEILSEKNNYENKYIFEKSQYEYFLKKFIVNIDNLNNRSKRILIDLIVDKVIVSKERDSISAKIIFNPSRIIKDRIVQ